MVLTLKQLKISLVSVCAKFQLLDLVGRFGDPWWPFGFFEVLIEAVIKSKNSFSKKNTGGLITKGLTYFQTPPLSVECLSRYQQNCLVNSKFLVKDKLLEFTANCF